jgi:DNA-binding NarL/FixJ family response regulator
MKKSVFVVDDHAAVREGFKAILERSGGYSVSGEAGSAEEVLARLDAGEGPPDLFVVDVSLPGMNGIELVGALRRRTPAPAVMLSMHRRYDYIAQALKAGASGYVSKDASIECITLALAAASQGGCYLDPASLRLFIDEIVGGRREIAAASPGSPAGPPLSARIETGQAGFPSDFSIASAASRGPATIVATSGLSDREKEVLDHLASGERAEEIAHSLGLSQKTVENHLSNITAKLGIHSRFELYRFAARLGPAQLG